MVDFVILTDVYAHGFIRSAGAHRIATVLRRHGVTVQIIDLVSRMSEDEFRQCMDKYVTAETKFVGISNTFLNDRTDHSLFPNQHGLEIVNEFKQKFGFKVILGGNRNSTDSVIENDYLNCIDLIVTGFADKAITEIYDNYDLLQYEMKQGYRILNADSPRYVFEDFEHADIEWHESDHIFHGEALPIEIARGCIFRCSYCFFPLNGKGKPSKYMKTEEVIRKELIDNYEKYGTTVYDLMDDLVNDSPGKIEMLHRIFTSLPFKIQWTGYARPDLVIARPHTLDLMSESGCVALRFGIESFHPPSLKAIGKGMPPDKIKQGLQWMVDNSDISLGGSFIAGLPFETKDSLREMCDWLVDPSSPLHQKQLIVLSIPRTNGRHDSSRMMVDPDKYGYKDLNPDNKYYMEWDNGFFDIHYARKVYQETWDELVKQSVYISHDAFRIYNLGYDLKDIVNRKMNTFDPNEKFDAFKDKYLSRLLEEK